jgi:alpha-beta hydrolase superfamily lysophospholipase
VVGDVLLVHGIGAEKDEDGRYVRLAAALADAGYRSLRFSFRGHGHSGGGPLAITIANEVTDVQSVLLAMDRMAMTPSSIVVSSFGTVPTLLALNFVSTAAAPLPGLGRLVLWYPVLDLRGTFLEPDLPWGKAHFGPQAVDRARREGSLVVEGPLLLPATLFAEMEHYDIEGELGRAALPTLVVHGSADTYVSYDVSRRAAAQSAMTTLMTIDGADHGFMGPGEEAAAVGATVAFVASGRRAESR